MNPLPYMIFGDVNHLLGVLPTGQTGPWTDNAGLGVLPKGSHGFVSKDGHPISATGPTNFAGSPPFPHYVLRAALADSQALLEINKITSVGPEGKTTYSGVFMGRSKQSFDDLTTDIDADAKTSLLEPLDSLDDADAAASNRWIAGVGTQIAQGTTSLILTTALQAPPFVKVWVYTGNRIWKPVLSGVHGYDLKDVKGLVFLISAPEGFLPGFFQLRFGYHGA